MPELSADFQSLPEEYQHIIRMAQDQYNITVAPLELLVGGWSGAMVYLVSVSANETKRVEHCILKLNRSEEHTSELQSQSNLVCRLLLEKKKKIKSNNTI